MSDFHTTHWSLILSAIGEDTTAASALKTLCERYYEPVLRYIERTVRNDSPHVYGGRGAEDLTHDFFAIVLSGKFFPNFERKSGRFRSYLIGSIRHFLSNVRERESSMKRGGSRGRIQLDKIDPITVKDDSDDLVFDYEWARHLVDRVLELLDDRKESRLLLPWLMRDMPSDVRKRLASELGLSDIAIKVYLHRLRKSFRTIIRSKIAETVESELEIGLELDHLIKALLSGTDSNAK